MHHAYKSGPLLGMWLSEDKAKPENTIQMKNHMQSELDV